MNESAKVEGGCGRERKRITLQHYSAHVPDEARVEGELEEQHTYAHCLR
jgi:hypothetical protein